jgi:hypothetical protein
VFQNEKKDFSFRFVGLPFVSYGDDSSEGTFTLTDIPAQYNGEYAVLWATAPNTRGIWGCISQDSTGSTLPQISNGKVTIPLWHGNGIYTGNDTYVTASDYSSRIFVKIVGNKVIQNMDEPGDAVFFISVTFPKVVLKNPTTIVCNSYVILGWSYIQNN